MSTREVGTFTASASERLLCELPVDELGSLGKG